MPSFNKVIVVGHVGKDPEMRFTTNGKPVTNFSVATSEKVGESEHTEWFKIVVWGKQAETTNQYLTKGSLVMVEGRLRTSSWEDTEGNRKYKTEIIANRVLFLDKKKVGEDIIDPWDSGDEVLPF